jgi:hypothetical protein
MASLPFDQQGEIRDQAGTVLATIACHLDPLPSPRRTGSGATYEWQGEAELSAAEHVVGKPNRTLVIDGRWLKIVGAAAHTILPHVELQLSEPRPAG